MCDECKEHRADLRQATYILAREGADFDDLKLARTWANFVINTADKKAGNI